MREAPFQWEAIRKRLQASEDSLQQALEESPERTRAVYRQRAVQLAKGYKANTPASKSFPALIFRLAQERYAIDLKDLVEVLTFQGCAQVPGSSPQFLGVISLRGELRPIINLARVLSAGSSTDEGMVLMLRRQLGLKVDGVEDLRNIVHADLAPHSHSRYIQGLAPGPVIVLDVEALVSAELSPKGVLIT